jgi:hypothetical protein
MRTDVLTGTDSKKRSVMTGGMRMQPRHRSCTAEWWVVVLKPA